MKLMFSLLVHERPEVVLDTICNLRAFHDDLGVVLHISRNFDYASKYMDRHRFWEILKTMPNVYINPKSFATRWKGPGVNGLVNIHIANFDYLASLGLDYEYFIMMSSNELYIKKGLYDFIKDYDLGNNEHSTNTRPDWAQTGQARQDDFLREIISDLGGEEIFGAQIEGSFFKREVFGQMAQYLSARMGQRILGGYACEEIYFPTLCHYLFQGKKTRYHGSTAYLPWHKQLVIDKGDIDSSLKDERLFSVKRIPRIFDDELRCYIRSTLGSYGDEKSLDIPWSCVRNEAIEETRYMYSDELRQLKDVYRQGQLDIYDVLSCAKGCQETKDASYLLEMLLCDKWDEVYKVLDHLARLVPKDSLLPKMLVLEKTGNIKIDPLDLEELDNYLVFLRVLLRKHNLLANEDMLRSFCMDDVVKMVLLEVFIRLAKDDRLQYYSLRGGREVWLHYSPYCNSRVNLQYPVSKDDDGRLWPMADRENDAAFVMCMKLVETGIYYGIEFSSTNHQAYEALMDAFQIENVLSAGSYEVLRLGEGVVGLESLSELKDGLNQAMDLFCSCGEKLLAQLSDQ